MSEDKKEKKKFEAESKEPNWEEFDFSQIQGVLPDDINLTQNIGCVGKSQIKRNQAEQKN